MKKLRPYYLLAFFLFSFSNCKKSNGSKLDNPYGLPNATQNGSMVFACRINGQNRIAAANITSQNGNISKDSVTVFSGFGDAFYFEDVSLIVYGNVKINTPYVLEDTMQTGFSYDTDSTCFGISSNVIFIYKAYGTITFTKLDSINKIISGNFSLKVPVPGCDTLNFTDGRFDVRY
jgi:hypothetical protein